MVIAMKATLFILLIALPARFISDGIALPHWFLRTYKDNRLQNQFEIITSCTPAFLEADFNGDHKTDIAVQVRDIEAHKKGILIINNSTQQYYIFGAGKKFNGESFDNTNWMTGWTISRVKIIYKSLFRPDGDIYGSKKIKLTNPVIYIHDSDSIAGEMIYWTGSTYISVHQGE